MPTDFSAPDICNACFARLNPTGSMNVFLYFSVVFLFTGSALPVLASLCKDPLLQKLITKPETHTMAQSMLAGEEVRLCKCSQIHMRYAFIFKFLIYITKEARSCFDLSQQSWSFRYEKYQTETEDFCFHHETRLENYLSYNGPVRVSTETFLSEVKINNDLYILIDRRSL
jgi:hypothetical protein